MKTCIQRWLACVALPLVAIAAWGTSATAQSLSGVYGDSEQCYYTFTFRGNGVVYIQFLVGPIGEREVQMELPGQYKVDGDKISVTAPNWGTVLTRKGNALYMPAAGGTSVCTKQDVGHAPPRVARTPMANTKIASMKSDLRNLVTAEEAFFADSVKYSGTTSCTEPPTEGTVNFCVTDGNNLAGPTMAGRGSGGGWSATMTNNNLTNPLVTCAIFVNTTPVAPATTEGAPACR